MMDAELVEARLIEAVRAFDRMEVNFTGWATDGPWRQMALLRSERYSPVDDLDDHAHAVASAIRSPYPDRDMQRRASEAAAWLGLVTEGQRRLILVGVRALSSGHSRVPWARLMLSPALIRDLGTSGVATSDGLRMAYGAALKQMARAVRRQMLVGA
jgi:hypothetical protein